MKKIYETCTMCQNFDPNRQTCNLTGNITNQYDQKLTASCKAEGKYSRYMHVFPDSFNLFPEGADVPAIFQPDYSKLSKDKKGVPLFVLTKRGTERVLPVDGRELFGDDLIGVTKIFTYQGQREIIYDLGVELARKEAAWVGVELQVLPEEEGMKGQTNEVQAFLHNQGKYQEGKRKTSWLMQDDSMEWWEA